ncbi:Hint domain-containing protein [Aestuariivita boseongensis]|uniref:Hint domain-containing protein n=1 Tax=Aestuariivita boseongensis TaxID=1470562 RepID=UPI000682AF09|nr:Hint domain-containing protein [Aestuariivita boseongensis]
MAETTILLNGYSILEGASISVSNNDGYLNEGSVSVTGGTMIFEPDDIIVMQVINADTNGGVSSDSEITQILVYDNAQDYLNDAVKFTYEGNNSNQTGTIRGDTAGVGDRYLRINANRLTSSDPDAPDINQLFLAAGYDLTDVANGDTITIDQFQDSDYNANDTIDGGSLEEADGVFTGGAQGNNSLVTICFARGTLIDTPHGPQFIETLRQGDLVNTLDGGAQPIRWIGSQRVEGRGPNTPVLVRAGALGNLRDLRVSPNHRMMLRSAQAELLFGQSEVLASAKYLVNGDTIRGAPCDEVDYYHFMMESHHIIFAEGCPAESLYPGPQSLKSVSAKSRAEIVVLFPGLAENATEAPMVSRYTLREHEATALLSLAG